MLLLALFALVFSELAPLHRNGDIIEGSYIVFFKESEVGIYSEEFLSAKQMFGERIGHVYNHVVKGYAVQKATEEEITMIRSNPNVQFVEHDQVMSVAQGCKVDQNEKDVGCWGQQRVSQREVVTNTANFKFAAPSSGGEDVDIYIVDTGIHITHEDFTDKKKGTTTFPFEVAGYGKWDRNGHGTHVASTSGGQRYGVAKNANLLAVKVLQDNGSGSNAGVISGVDFVAQQHERSGNKKSVANMSLGGSFSAALNAAVGNAIAKGVVFVVAAGNSNDDACGYSPASERTAISVGATAQSGDVRSTFSNFGPNCVTLFAPGTSIKAAWYTSNTATNTISGTSMASPHVAGLSALIVGDHKAGSITPAQVKQRLIDESTKDAINFANCAGTKVTQCRDSHNRLGNSACHN